VKIQTMNIRTDFATKKPFHVLQITDTVKYESVCVYGECKEPAIRISENYVRTQIHHYCSTLVGTVTTS
jgi:hypothetical protein